MKKKSHLILVGQERIYEKAWAHLVNMTGFSRMPQQERLMQQKMARRVFLQEYQQEKISILLQEIEPERVKNGYFQLESGRITCRILERIPQNAVKKVYFYAFHAPPSAGSEDLLVQYYEEGWQVALLDAAREWLAEEIVRWQKQETPGHVGAVTPSIGPGYYGMPLSAMTDLCRAFPVQQAGITMLSNGNLSPLKSNMGIYLVTQEAYFTQWADCVNCIGGQEGCHWCLYGKEQAK